MASLRASGPRADGVSGAVPGRPVTNTYSDLVRAVTARVRAFLDGAAAPCDNEATPVPFARAGQTVRDAGDESLVSRPALLASEAARTAWAALPPWRVLLVWERLIAMVLDDALSGTSRTACATSFASRAHPTPSAAWIAEPFVEGLLVDIVRVVVAGRCDRAFVLRLSRLRELLLHWLRPPSERARNPAQVTFLLHVSGWCLHLALSAWQFRRGAGCVALARQRCAGMPALVTAALRAPSGHDGAQRLVAWLCGQTKILLDIDAADGCVYVLGGARHTYIGSTCQRARRGGAATLGLPAVRFGQHVSSIMRMDAKGGLHKVRVFAREPHGLLLCYVALTGTRDTVRAAEDRLIRMLRPRGNTTLATRGGWRADPADPADPDYAARRPRGRPWPRARRCRACAGGPMECLAQDLGRVVEMWTARVAAMQQAQAARRLRECHFLEAYDGFRATPAGREYGPHTVLQDSGFDMLVAWVCTRDSDVDWSLIVRVGGRRLLYRLAFALLHLRRPGRRLQGIRRWRFGSSRVGELPWRFGAVRVPHAATVEARRALRSRLLDGLARGCRWRRAWVAERVRFVKAPVTTFARGRFGMAEAARTARCSALRAMSPDWAARAARGEDLVRIKMYWKLPMPASPARQWRDQLEELHGFVRRLAPAGVPASLPCEQIAAPFLAQRFVAPDPAFAAYSARLPMPSAEQVLVIEDKDTAAAWLMGRAEYQWRGLRCIESDGAWRPSGMPASRAAALVAAAFRSGELRTALRPVSEQRWLRGLPALYTTQKAKCWDTGRHVCTWKGTN